MAQTVRQEMLTCMHRTQRHGRNRNLSTNMMNEKGINPHETMVRLACKKSNKSPHPKRSAFFSRMTDYIEVCNETSLQTAIKALILKYRHIFSRTTVCTNGLKSQRDPPVQVPTSQRRRTTKPSTKLSTTLCNHSSKFT